MIKIANKYSQITLAAVEKIRVKNISPSEAWESFGDKKGCPKSAFLGLCEAGYVNGVPKGYYTTSTKNKRYAILAVQLLIKNPELALDIKLLWENVAGGELNHNGQMDVVLALWNMNLINKKYIEGASDMWDDEQVTDDAYSMPDIRRIFAENPESRCACILLLDVSGSMQGDSIKELNEGLQKLKEALSQDSLAEKRVELAIVTFGGKVELHTDFISPDCFCPSLLRAGGNTPMGEAIQKGISLLAQRKKIYKENGIRYYRPWIFLITDGQPTDSWGSAMQEVHAGEAAKTFSFFAVGTDSADFNILSQISPPGRTPLKLKENQWDEMFTWLSNSLTSVSQSRPDEKLKLLNPATPDGWAEVSL